MNYDLTVSIVTYNTEKEILLKILECLQKIKVNIKIFISDNSEKDNIKEIIEELNDKRIDYIFINKKVKVLKSSVIFNGKNKPIISDHYGVELDIVI